MSVSIRGARIESLIITIADGKETVTGEYSLVGTNDKVLAKQAFNTYGGIKIEMSGDTQQALCQYLTSVKNDISKQMGLGEEGK